MKEKEKYYQWDYECLLKDLARFYLCEALNGQEQADRYNALTHEVEVDDLIEMLWDLKWVRYIECMQRGCHRLVEHLREKGEL